MFFGKLGNKNSGVNKITGLISFLLVALLFFGVGCDSESSESSNNLNNTNNNEQKESFELSVMVSGLEGELVLLNNGGDSLVITEDGRYYFDEKVVDGEPYNITVATQPQEQTCIVENGQGIMSSLFTITLVNCSWPIAEAVPVLRIETENEEPVTSKEEYLNGVYELESTDGTIERAGTLLVKGRGNSTWNYPKKPFKLKLTVSAPLAGMPPSRHWILLANYLDKSLIRTDVAMEFSRRLGMAWTPRSLHVEVELNGHYIGLYQLMEHVRIDNNRVDISELEGGENAPEDLRGGYLLEIDYNQGENYCFHAPLGTVFCFSDPEELLQTGWEEHKAYIDGFLTQAEAALYGEHFTDPEVGYSSYIDVDSAVDFYLVHELTKNPDSNFFSSIYLYKPRDEEKLYFGPVWDFDLSLGNAQWAMYGFFDGSTSQGWHTRKQDNRVEDPVINWYVRLFEDPAFEQRVRDRWSELHDQGVLTKLLQYVDKRGDWLSVVQTDNFSIWEVLDRVLQPDLSPVTGSYQNHVSAVRTFLEDRIEWIDSQLLQ
ncbi:MAG: CotH kinase family protein [Myxococcota bacterium]